ncbi:MAG: DNA polymerase III subunit gamma/tau [Neisseriaceae bacterium]|nr:MAG: DNA polymerase III subunit gamma/tau [Neisseriaceae bacterium]
MAYQVLARKFRPKKFVDLVGQEHVTQTLLNSVQQSRLHHAYLLTGTRGVGKTTIARILAKSLNCDNPVNGEPCGQCDACICIDEGRFVDLLEIDAASNTGIDNIREVLENAQYMPTVGKFKVYIIDEVHMLSKSAFNAMLKTLEEPPPHVKFILATTDPHKVPITILSRCLQFVLKNLNLDQIFDYLKYVLSEENIAYEEPSLYLIAKAANGSMRDALSLLDQSIALANHQLTTEVVQKMLGVVDQDFLYDIFLALNADNKTELYTKINQLLYQSVGFSALLDEMALILKDLATAKLFSLDLHPENEKFSILANVLSDEEIQIYYQTIINGKKDQVIAPDEYTGFLMTIMRILSFRPYFFKDKSQNIATISDNDRLKKKINYENNDLIKKTVPKQAILNQSFDEISQEVKKNHVNNHLTSNNIVISVDDWYRYIQKVNKKIGTYIILTKQLALVGTNNQGVICAIQNENDFGREILIAGKKNIEKTFMNLFNLQVTWQPWTDNLIPYHSLKKIHDSEMEKKGLEYLHSDKVANKLKELFKGEWDAQSIRFKNID